MDSQVGLWDNKIFHVKQYARWYFEKGQHGQQTQSFANEGRLKKCFELLQELDILHSLHALDVNSLKM